MKFFKRRQQHRSFALPVLQTERLVLRCFDVSDAVDVYTYAKNPAVGLMAGWQPHESIAESREWIEDILEDGHTWAIVEKKSGRVIGALSLRPDHCRRLETAMEIGFALGETHWGQGYATEACLEGMRYAFNDMGCMILAVRHIPSNVNCRRTVKKLGYTCEGTMRKALAVPGGEPEDLVAYSMTQDEYRALCAR
ncbi:MAG: GNAT family protein [Eubacteriales bacterium]|nr:GNAT family protein [Eubacteriales bacterium]